jgi:quinol monooxygenase YgiN
MKTARTTEKDGKLGHVPASAHYRAIVVLKAKPGQAQKLLDFTLEVLPQIRLVDGLQKLEINRSTTDPGELVLYYWWETPTHSQQYVAGPLYASIGPKLQALVQEHQLYMTENLA